MMHFKSLFSFALVLSIFVLGTSNDAAANSFSKPYNPSPAASFAQLGGSKIYLNKMVSGTLFSTGSKTWDTIGSVSSGHVKVTVEKTMGTGKASVKIYTKNGSHSRQLIKEMTWDRGSGNIGDTKVRHLKNCAGKQIIVVLDGKSFSDKFGYKLTLTPQ